MSSKHTTQFADALPALRQGRPAPAALVERRALIAGARVDQPADPAMKIVERSRGGVRGIECSVQNPQRTIVHFHGGGYRLGEPRSWVPFAKWLARLTNANVILPDYRLAPENPFPAALHDAAAVYADLLQEGTAPVISGDSAGGGLAAALIGARDALGLAAPPGVVLISPWLDLTITSGTFASRGATDKLFSLEAATEGSEQYLQGHSAKDPLASPLFASATAFPPTLLFAGGHEVLLGDSIAFCARLAEAGVSVESHFVAGMQHVWPTIFPDLPESVTAMDAVARFVRRVSPDRA